MQSSISADGTRDVTDPNAEPPPSRCRSAGQTGKFPALSRPNICSTIPNRVDGFMVYPLIFSSCQRGASISPSRPPTCRVFAAAGVQSGLAPGSAIYIMLALGAMRGRPAPDAEPLGATVNIFHGFADTTVAPVNAAGEAIGRRRSRGRKGRWPPL